MSTNDMNLLSRNGERGRGAEHVSPPLTNALLTIFLVRSPRDGIGKPISLHSEIACVCAGSILLNVKVWHGASLQKAKQVWVDLATRFPSGSLSYPPKQLPHKSCSGGPSSG